MEHLDAHLLAKETKKMTIVLKRWGALVLDHVLLIILWLVVFTHLPDDLLWIVTLFYFSYFIVSESIYGKTFGKHFVGIVVVDKHGNRVGWGRSCVRNVLRMIEVNPLLVGGLPSLIMIIASKKHQRLGDLLSGSYVLESEKLNHAKAERGHSE
jgi:uncharacterized RDD family membrane protein YckC